MKQLDQLITKEDLNNAVTGLVTKAEFNEFENSFYHKINVIMKKLDNIEYLLLSKQKNTLI